jgi:presenilin-like A22 family membrane protease
MGNKINSQFIIFFIILFFSVQIIGLITANYYSSMDIRFTIINDDPNDIINAIAIILYILLVTGLILFLKRFFKKSGYLYIFEIFALLIGITIVLDIFLPYLSALLISFLLILIRNVLKANPSFKKILLWYNNILLGIAIAGAGSTIGLSLGIIPVVVFLILLSVYDIIAVFYTKHMVTLAKIFVKQNLALTFALPTKKKTYQLGGGDLVVPLIMSSSFYFVLIQEYSFITTLIPIILIWIASVFGLLWTFWFLANNKRNIKVMPALPPQAILMFIVIIISYLFIL